MHIVAEACASSRWAHRFTHILREQGELKKTVGPTVCVRPPPQNRRVHTKIIALIMIIAKILCNETRVGTLLHPHGSLKLNADFVRNIRRGVAHQTPPPKPSARRFFLIPRVPCKSSIKRR